MLVCSSLFDLYLTVKWGRFGPVYLLSPRLRSGTLLPFLWACRIHHLKVTLPFRRMLWKDTSFDYWWYYRNIGTTEQPVMIDLLSVVELLLDAVMMSAGLMWLNASVFQLIQYFVQGQGFRRLRLYQCWRFLSYWLLCSRKLFRVNLMWCRLDRFKFAFRLSLYFSPNFYVDML